jgi:hypothetical protein
MISTCELPQLIQTQLVGKKVDLVAVVDQLLGMAHAAGELRCQLASDEAIRFEFRGEEPVDIPVDLAKGKLRAMCARLGWLCHESGQTDISLYGDEGTFRRNLPSDETANGSSFSWRLKFMNTPGEQYFIITVQ